MSDSAEFWERFVWYALRVVDAGSDGMRALLVDEYRADVAGRRGDEVADLAVKELRGFAWGVMQGKIKRPVVK